MFDPDFFPTPGHVVSKMLEPYRLGNSRMMAEGAQVVRTILEPSAGKGDILNRIVSMCGGRIEPGEGIKGYYGPRLMAIERNPELVSILQANGYRVVANDFLTYQPETHADLIVMNPPFSDGDSHLLHAWKILDHGDIVCLLNAETIRNPYTSERKLLAKIIEDHGVVEYLGQVFRGAERSTDVEVVMARLHKERTGRGELEFDFEVPAGESEALPDFDLGDAGSAVMRPDQVGAMIRQYEMAKRAFVDFLRARDAMVFYCQGVCSGAVLELANESCGTRFAHANKEAAYDTFKDGLRLKFWEHVLGSLGIDKLLTAKMRKTFAQFVEQQGAMALTKENIGKIVSTMLLNSDSILKQAVGDVFDLFTKYHDENRHHPEGWKTNEKWMVGKKVILPNFVRYEFKRFGTAYGRHSEYDDIDRAMCYLTGKRLEDIVTIKDAIKPHESKSESEFFQLRYFQKGTMHLVFKDEALWARFNQVACEGRNWLGNKS